MTARSALDSFLEREQMGATALVVGVDPSLTSTGLAVAAFDDEGQVQVETGRVASKLRGHDRLEEVLAGVVRVARSADLVVLEGLAMAGHDTNRAGAGLSWLIRHELWRERVDVAICPPSNRIMYALGKGVGGKDAVLAATIGRYRHLTTIDQNDVADAVVMLAMGCRHLGRSLEPAMPATHLRALVKVDWPAAGRAVLA